MTAALARLPRGPGPAAVEEVARRLLDWVVAWWDDHAGQVTPLPPRRYLAAGAPREIAWDSQTGQVTVALERVITGLDPGAPPASARSPRANPANVGRVNRIASLEVQIVRCIPLPDLGTPSPEQIDEQAEWLTADAGHLLSAVVEATRDGALLREHVGQGGVQIGDVLTLGPMGGAAAVALSVAVPLL